MSTPEKESAMEFLRLACSGRVRDAALRLIAPDFSHHNPFFPAGPTLLDAMEANAKANPQKSLEIKRVLQDGEFVAIHSRVRQRPNDAGGAVVHIFRFKGGKIQELWDIGQPVPLDSPNTDGMF